jgi:hypothetical protein
MKRRASIPRHPAALIAVVALGILGFPSLSPAQVVLSFDDVAAGPLSTQYATKGATFNLPMVRNYSQTPGFTHSGAQAVELCFAAEFCKGQLNVGFTTNQTHVMVFVGFTSPLGQASPVLMKALDQNGAVVGQATAVLGPSSIAIPVQVPLEIISSAANIRQIIAGFASPDAFNNGLVFDDFEFDAAGPPPICTTQVNPTVALSAPLTSTVQINEFLLQGMVQTAASLDQATLTVTSPGSTKVTNLLSTIIQPAGGPFGATAVDESLSPGANTVTVTAHNCHGAGQASATVIYAPVADGTAVKLVGMEITQATQDLANSVPLIGGKPTVLRLYFSVTGPTLVISGVSGFITGYREGGDTPLLATSIGTTTIDASQDIGAKRLDLTKSLNFILSPDFFAPGLIHFWLVNLHVQGPGGAVLACDGCTEWNASFGQSHPLDLVVVPFFYSFSSLTADAGASLMGALGWLNNVFPISGNFPTDSAGINLMLQPQQTTALILPRDNDRFLFDLQSILDDLKSQPGSTVPTDAHLLGVIPSGSGGAANRPGDVAYGDSRAVEGAPQPSDPESYGSIWAQEIAHNFGRMHVSTSHGEMPPVDPNYPYQHGGIGEPGMAIGTEGWNGSPFIIDPGIPVSGSKHAHDFMSYGAPNDPQDHTHSWVSPYTYKGLMSSFLFQAQATRAPTAIPKLVVGGVIGADGTATLYPFHIVNTGFASGPGTAGALSIDLIDSAGQTVETYQFDAHPIEPSSSFSFHEFVPWKSDTKQIVLRRNNEVLAKRVVSLHAPSVKVISPVSGETWGAKATITWQASDADNDPLTYTVLYNNGLDARWLPVATNVTGTTLSIDTALLAGSTKARVRVRATDGVNTAEGDSAGTFTVPEKSPLVAVIGVTNGNVLARQHAEFSGAAYDPKDGLLDATRLHWTSDRDGSLGYGRHLVLSRPLSSGRHVITLTATNGRGLSASSRVTIVVR